MKKLVLLLTLLLGLGISHAQKMAYVDTQLILKQIPQYQQAEQRLSIEVKKWKEEIQNQQSNLDKLKLAFENEKVLLTDDQQKSRMAAIDSTEKKLNTYVEKKFGTKGESVTLRTNLMKPLQDQIWNAVNTIANKEKYNIIFNKSSDLIMVFADPKYDITNKILKQLKITEDKTSTDKNKKSTNQPVQKTTNNKK